MKNTDILSVIATLLTLVPWNVNGVCVKENPCRCTYTDGSGSVDLSSIGRRNGTPRFIDVKGKKGDFYSYDPCFTFNEGNCQDVAVCRRDGSKTTDIGNADSSDFVIDPSGSLIIIYNSTSAELVQSTTRVYVFCDSSAFEPLLIVANAPKVANTYSLSLITQCGCPGRCPNIFYVAPPLSVGSVAVMIFGTVILIYCISGTLFLRIKRKHRGLESVPHLAFWKSLPGAVKDGLLFVGSKLGINVRTGYTKM